MKVLISDDESHVIQAIRLLVPWDTLGISQIFTASGGTEAIEIIERETPEIVITDIVMEDNSGIDIMNFVASEYPSVRVIAVSGHNDYEYVRTMLTKGCVDYLLKPLEPEALITAVQNAVQSWKREQESTLMHRHFQEKMNSLSSFYSSVLLHKILDAKRWDVAYRELLQTDTRFTSVTSCKLLYYNSGYFPMRDPDFSRLLKSFEEQVRQHLEQGGGIVLSRPDHPGVTAFFLYQSPDCLSGSIIRDAQSAFTGKPYPFHIGVSRELAFPEQFSEAYHQAKDAFLSAFGDSYASATAITSSFFASRSEFIPETERLHMLEQRMLSSLLIGDKHEIERSVTDYLSCLLPEKDIPLRQIRDAIETLHGLFSQWISGIKKKLPSFSYDPEKALLVYGDLTGEDYLFSRERMRRHILTILSDISDEMKKSRSTADIMSQIAEYMELNYQKPFIQSEYARLFYINKDYMSRKFTNTFHVSMLTYLNQIRIRHAKELLGDNSLKIQDIAYAVGFKDEKYFAKQFKKLTGATPGDYRAALRSTQ